MREALVRLLEGRLDATVLNRLRQAGKFIPVEEEDGVSDGNQSDPDD